MGDNVLGLYPTVLVFIYVWEFMLPLLFLGLAKQTRYLHLFFAAKGNNISDKDNISMNMHV